MIWGGVFFSSLQFFFFFAMLKFWVVLLYITLRFSLISGCSPVKDIRTTDGSVCFSESVHTGWEDQREMDGRRSQAGTWLFISAAVPSLSLCWCSFYAFFFFSLLRLLFRWPCLHCLVLENANVHLSVLLCCNWSHFSMLTSTRVNQCGSGGEDFCAWGRWSCHNSPLK